VVSVDGVPVSAEECRRRWRPWSPADVRDRLGHIEVPWGVAAGWAIDLFLGTMTRDHDDIEITVPAASFPVIADALIPCEWDVVGAARIWPYPETLDRFHQTWLRDVATGEYHLDVFREPHDGENWICRRDPTIVLPYVDVYEWTDDGIPFVIPEVVLLFKARDVRPKDQADFEQVIEVLSGERRSRLATWLRSLDSRHRWLPDLTR
jgi:hypothetical protein